MAKVVVIGGGFAGMLVCRGLERGFDVTLIDTKDFFEFTPSVPQVLVEPSHLARIHHERRRLLRRAQTVVAEATSVTRDAVLCGDIAYPYDYLVIATGSSYTAPFKAANAVRADRGGALALAAERLAAAASVAIIGGGPVGVEVASEIVLRYPKKRITLIHGASELLERSPQKARVVAARFLTQRGVAIRINTRVERVENDCALLAGGDRIEAELFFLCTGLAPNTAFTADLPRDGRGFIMVDEHLQVRKHLNVFVAGDANDVQEEKLAQSAQRQAAVVVTNIRRLAAGTPLVAYRVRPKPMVINFGRSNGVFYYKDFVVAGYLPGLLKRFIEWKELRRYR